MLVVLMGMAALAVDVGYWRYQQRLEQSAADSAAITGADELNYPAAADWSTAAKTDAAANGFTDDGGVTLSVTPHNPPTTGAYAGNTSAVQVVISEKQPAFFGATLGFTSQWVSARAVAVLLTTTRNCVYALGTSGYDVTINGANVNAPRCGISSNGGLLVNGSTVTAAFMGYVGQLNSNGSNYTTGRPAISVPQSDPCPSITGCAYLAANPPSSGACLTPTLYNGGSSATIPAGRYCTLLTVNGVSNVTFSAGLYEFDGGLTVNGASNVTGTGVTFYNGPSGSAILINGSSVNLSAPTTGNTAGVMMYQSPSNTSGFTLNGSGAGLAGLLYFPTANVVVNGALSTWLLLVASTILINGSGVNVPSAAFPVSIGHAVLGE
jgi:hypothetical protein